ncbi:hypothetical protein BH20ACI4_BH20ACI4_32590 [soil metagenome]
MSDEKIKPKFITVPFKAESPNGMMHYHGIAKFSFAGVVVEFEPKILGLVGGEVKEVQIALDEIFDIKFRKGIYKFFGQIQFRLQNYQKISQLPNKDGKVKLNIKREDYELAREAVEQTLQYMKGVSTPVLESADESEKQLSPVQTSVNELFDTEKLEKEDSRKTEKLDRDRHGI